MDFYKSVKAPIDIITSYLENLSIFKKIETSIRKEERESNFPRATVLPKREILDSLLIGGDLISCQYLVQIIIEIREYKKKVGADDLLKITGDVIDALYKMRKNEKESWDNFNIESITNNFEQGPNCVVYASIINLQFNLTF